MICEPEQAASPALAAPQNPLDDPLIDALVVVARSNAFVIRDDYDIAFRVPTPDSPRGYVVAVVPGDDFDALVERGWVELIGQDDFQVTQGGKYWYDRWEAAQEKAAKLNNRARRAMSWRRARRS